MLRGVREIFLNSRLTGNHEDLSHMLENTESVLVVGAQSIELHSKNILSSLSNVETFLSQIGFVEQQRDYFKIKYAHRQEVVSVHLTIDAFDGLQYGFGMAQPIIITRNGILKRGPVTATEGEIPNCVLQRVLDIYGSLGMGDDNEQYIQITEMKRFLTQTAHSKSS